MNPHFGTALALTTVLLFIVVYNLAAAHEWGLGGTISLVIKDWGQKWPALRLAAAVAFLGLYLHLFFY